MTEDRRRVQLEAEMGADGVRKGAAEVKQVVGDMTADVAAKAKQAAAAVDGIGNGGQQAGEKIDRTTRSIVQSIERTTAALKAGERGSSSYFEILANQRGANLGALEPYLQQLREAERLQGRATGNLNEMGRSAKETAAALRQVPAQLTDIIVSLQGGTAPLTVFLQQGGQLRDIFGSAAIAARELGRFVLGLITPLSVLGATLVAIGAGAFAGSQETQDLNRSLVLTGNAAGKTVPQLQSMARAIDDIGGGGRGKAAEVLQALVETGRVGADGLQRFAAAALLLERAGGPAIEKTAAAFADLAKNPLDAALKLNEATNFLTRSALEQIRSLEQQGRTADAARVAQDAYADAIEQRAPAILQQLGLMERAWLGIKGGVSAVVDALKDIGRPGDTIGAQIQAIEARIAANNRDAAGGSEIAREAAARGNDILTARLRLLQQAAGFEALSATYQRQSAEQLRATVEFDKQGEQLLDRRVKMEREIAQARALGAAAGKDAAEIEARVAAIREKFKTKPDQSAEREEEKRVRLLNELAGLTASYTEDIGRLNALQREGKLTGDAYNQAVQELIEKQPFARKAAQERAESQRAAAQLDQQFVTSYVRYIAELEKGVEVVEAQIQRELDEAEALKLVTQRNISLAEAIQEVAIARLEEKKASGPLPDEQVNAINREIERRRQLITLLNNRAIADGVRKSAEDASKQWDKTSQQIEDRLTDALFNAFKNGEDFGDSLARSVQSAFDELVLRPIVRGVVSPLFNGAFSSLGLGGTGAGGAGGYGSLLNNASSAASLASFFGSSGSFGSAFNAGAGLTFSGAGGTGLALEGAGAALAEGGLSTGFGQALGAIAPYAAVIVALWAVAEALDDSGTPSVGSVVGGSTAGGNLSLRTVLDDPSTITQNLDPTLDASLRAITGASLNTLNTIDRVFGGAGGLTALAKFASDNNDPAVGSFNVRGPDGRSLVEIGSDSQFKQFGVDPNAAYRQFTSEIALQTLQALNELDLPAWARDLVGKTVRELGDNPSTEALIQALGNITAGISGMQSGLVELQRYMEPLGGVFIDVAGLSSDAVFQLQEFAGGLDLLQSQVAGYAQNYLTRDEIAGLRAREVVDALKTVGFSQDQLQGLDSREDFRALVDSIDVSTEDGRRQLAALLAVQQSFADISDYLLDAGGSLTSAADLAPNTGIFGEPGAAAGGADETVDAVNGVRESVDEVARLLEQLLEVARQNGQSDFSDSLVQPEVPGFPTDGGGA